MSERVRIPLDVPSLIERTDGALVFTARDRAAYVDLATWPPRIVQRDEYTLDAARGADGMWLAYVKRDGAWTLRWYRDDDANVPLREDAEPVPPRDFTQFTGKLDAPSQRIEAAHQHRIESVHVCGGDAVVVPRHVGLGERRHPYVHRDGAWHEAVALPPFTKTVDDLRDRCCTAALRLGDGTDVLVWDGHVFAYDGTTFAHRFEQRLALAWFRDYAPVAFGRDRLFACSDHKLVELGPDGMRAHLPGVKASSVMRGPGDTLLVTTSGETLLFSPGDDTVASIDPDLLGRHGDVIGASGDGVVVHDTRERWLSLISAADLAALPRRRASDAPVVEPPPAQALFAVLGGAFGHHLVAASRPLVAGHGDRIAIACDTQLRLHVVDRPLALVTEPRSLVAVACDDRGGVSLSMSGELATLPPSRTVRELPGTMRSLAVGPGDAWLVLTAETTWLVDFAARTPVEIPFAAPIAAATDPDGTVLLAGEDRRLATWSNGALVDIPPALEQVVACVAVGRGRFVCAGQHHLCLLDVATRELELLQLPKGADDPDGYAAAVTPYLAASPNGTRIAWGRSATSVEIAALAGTRLERIDSVYYPSEYSGPDEPLAVHGLAFLDDHRLVILLDRGRANIVDLDSKQTLKLDPQPGDTPARWIFIYAGQTLIAD